VLTENLTEDPRG